MRKTAWRQWGGVVNDEEWYEVGEEVEGGRRLEVGKFAERFRAHRTDGAVLISGRVRRLLGWGSGRRHDYILVDGRYFQQACGTQTLSGEALAERRPGLSGRVFGPGESETFTIEGGGGRQRWRSVRRRAAAAQGRAALPNGGWVCEALLLQFGESKAACWCWSCGLTAATTGYAWLTATRRRARKQRPCYTRTAQTRSCCGGCACWWRRTARRARGRLRGSAELERAAAGGLQRTATCSTDGRLVAVRYGG